MTRDVLLMLAALLAISAAGYLALQEHEEDYEAESAHYAMARK